MEDLGIWWLEPLVSASPRIHISRQILLAWNPDLCLNETSGD